MFTKIKEIFKPEIYHGHNRKGNYFEGWYYKLVTDERKKTLAIIPGIFKSKDEKESHAFIQILDSANSYYLRFPLDVFKTNIDQNGEFNLKIADNYFSLTGIELNIMRTKVKLSGKVFFNNLKPWPVKLRSPGAMGWYAYLPFMECYHGVLSFDHEVEGRLSFFRNEIDFSRGRGYIEKDWGISFPRAWLWLQSNHFEEKQVSIMVSVAVIPWFGSEFRGLLAGLYYKGKFYLFTTYNGAKIKDFSLEKERIQLEVLNKNYHLLVKTRKKEGTLLYGPIDDKMIPVVKESLDAVIEVELRDKENKLIFSGRGKNAGLELNGDILEIID